MRAYSPLRYPGGKGQMYDYILDLLSKNNLLNCTYIEPYAGGAGIAIRLLFEKKVKKIIINDFDKSIYAVWHSILYQTNDFITLVKRTPVNMESWELQKKVQMMKDDVSLLELGFSTFFLNRTNRSGIIKGGVIGGKTQVGNYKMDCRFNKGSLICLIEKIAKHEQVIEIHNLDAIDFIKKVKNKQNQFYFIDPPYYDKGKELYTNFYNHDDHLNLSKFLTKSLKNKNYLISYDNSEEIHKMYCKFNCEIMELNYYAGTKRKGKEVFIKNNII